MSPVMLSRVHPVAPPARGCVSSLILRFMADALDEKAKRVRSLLSSYYGTGADASPGGGGAAPRLASIDSAAFDSRQFMLALVRRADDTVACGRRGSTGLPAWPEGAGRSALWQREQGHERAGHGACRVFFQRSPHARVKQHGGPQLSRVEGAYLRDGRAISD